jgi:hypothetical protein
MADINVRGWVSKIEHKESARGPYVKFTLKESQKDRDGQRYNTFYNVTCFKPELLDGLEDNSFAKLGGWFKVRQYEANGQKRQSLDIVAQELDIQPPITQSAPAPATDPNDPFGGI